MANTFLVGARSFGYKTAATGTAVVQNIDPIIGGRPAVVAFGVTAGGGGTNKAYFMVPLGRSTITTAVSATLTVTFAGELGPAGNTIATSDNIVIRLSDGTYQWTTVSLYDSATLSCTLASALTASVTAGAQVWNFGIYSDTGHMVYSMTVSAQSTKDTAGPGIFMAGALGDPMRLELPNALTQVMTIDYLTVAYNNS